MEDADPANTVAMNTQQKLVVRLATESSGHNNPTTTSLTFKGSNRQDVSSRKRSRNEGEPCSAKKKWTDAEMKKKVSKWAGIQRY